MRVQYKEILVNVLTLAMGGQTIPEPGEDTHELPSCFALYNQGVQTGQIGQNFTHLVCGLVPKNVK